MEKKKFLLLPIVAIIVTAFAFIPSAYADDAITVKYQAHVQGAGYAWEQPGVVTATDFMDTVMGTEKATEETFAGTQGLAKRVEAIAISLDTNLKDVKIQYAAHVQGVGYGWMDWKTAGSSINLDSEDGFAGTTGLAKRLEAISIVAPGLKEAGYELKYRAHVQGADYGWMDWKTAGEEIVDFDKMTTDDYAGTTGLAKRLEAIEIAIVKTDAKKLAEAKEKAVSSLNDTVAELEKAGTYTGEDTSYTTIDEDGNEVVNNVAGNAAEFKNAVADGTNSINAAEDAEAVEKALSDAVDAVKDVNNDETAAKALADAKEAAVDTINTYVNPNKYTENATELEAAISDGTAAINAATSVEEVIVRLLETENAIDAIHSDDVQKLIEFYTKTLDEDVANISVDLLKVIHKSEIPKADEEDAKTILETAYENGKSIIDGAADVSNVADAYDEAETIIIEAVKVILKGQLEDYTTANGNVYDDVNVAANKAHYLYADTAYQTALEEIAKATTYNKATSLYNAATKDAMTAADLDLNDAKNSVKKNLNEYATNALATKGIDTADRAAVRKALSDGEKAIDAVKIGTTVGVTDFATGVAEINGALEDAIEGIDAAIIAKVKTNAKAELDTYAAELKKSNTYTDKVVSDSDQRGTNFDGIITAAKTNIDDTTTDSVAAVNEYVYQAKKDLDETLNDIDAAIKAINEAVPNASNTNKFTAAAVLKAKETGIANVKSAKYITKKEDEDDNNGTATGKSIQNAVKTAIETIDAIADETDPVKAREQAVATLNSYKDASKYTQNAETLKDTIAAGVILLNEATDATELEAALNSAKAALDKVADDETLNTLTEAKNDALEKLDKYVAGLTGTYTQEDELNEDGSIDKKGNATLLNEAIADCKKAINEATSEADITTEYDKYIAIIGDGTNSGIDNDAKVISDKKAEALGDIATYYNVKAKTGILAREILILSETDSDGYVTKIGDTITLEDNSTIENKYIVQDTNLLDIIKNANTAIENATTVSEINNIVETTEVSLLSEIRTYTKELLKNFYDLGTNNYTGCTLRLSSYNAAVANIDNSNNNTITKVIDAYEAGVKSAEIIGSGVTDNSGILS